MKFNKLRIGTYNVRGLSTETKRNYLDQDLKSFDCDIVCLQETKIKDGYDSVHNNSRIICFETSTPQYGLGFVINKRVNIKEFWKINDRICVLQIKLSEKRICSVINVYTPSQTLPQKIPLLLRNSTINLVKQPLN